MKWRAGTINDFYDEDWMYYHYRYKSDHVKLDTDLFEVRDGALMKKGGTGRLEFNEVERLEENECTETALQILKKYTLVAGKFDPEDTFYRQCDVLKAMEEYKTQPPHPHGEQGFAWFEVPCSVLPECTKGETTSGKETGAAALPVQGYSREDMKAAYTSGFMQVVTNH